ncbi:hypothetical protein [Mangrovibacterium sp.]|uniref:DUF7281 domain-containing protein n=1 Tax=Mangrovibacterium sp. TaxID=1961364 RepID=UPI00356AAB8C
MNSKPLPLSFARCLIRLQDGEQLNPSEIKSKSLLKRFCEDGIIQKRALGNRRSGYVCANAEVLQNYLRVQNGILSLENYIAEFENDASDGVSSLAASKSTKTFRGKSLQGFFIKAINSELRISGKIVLPEPQGIELFVHQPEHLQISKTALVVGIENPECFLKFEKLAHLFPLQELVIVLRYMSNSPNRWLQTISNNYLHFGDFDPAGLSIYIHEYRRHLPAHRCDFFIPPNIEQLISRYGLSDLYDQQIHLLENIDRQQFPEIEKLIVILDTYKKGLEQERLLVIM